MEALATRSGSVISSALFGALAAAGVLPFDKSAFEATIQRGGRGAETSLKAFNAAYDRAREKPRDAVAAAPVKRFDPLPESASHPALDQLVNRIRSEFPPAAHGILFAGTKRLVDFQDPSYAAEYLDRLGAVLASDRAHGGEGRDFAFTAKAAKYVAVAMAYDDVIRVADLKVRGSRFARVRAEVGAKADQIVYTTEYMHPRMEEVCGALPKRLGRWIEDRPKLFARLDRLVNRGRAAGAAARCGMIVKPRIATHGLQPPPLCCRRTMTSRSRRSSAVAWSRAIPIPMRAACQNSTR
jgi:indolepyruvate ferredoxin oxidoreductase beta subunit